VPVFFTVTFAFGTTEPLLSVTVPTMSAVPWAIIMEDAAKRPLTISINLDKEPNPGMRRGFRNPLFNMEPPKIDFLW